MEEKQTTPNPTPEPVEVVPESEIIEEKTEIFEPPIVVEDLVGLKVPSSTGELH